MKRAFFRGLTKLLAASFGGFMFSGCQGMDPTPLSVDQTPPNFSAISDKTICRIATTSDGFWDTRPEYHYHIREAKRRGLSCGVGEASTTQTATLAITDTGSPPNAQNVEKDSRYFQFYQKQGIKLDNKTICTYATLVDKVVYWRADYIGESWRKEAKRRGLTCGVG